MKDLNFNKGSKDSKDSKDSKGSKVSKEHDNIYNQLKWLTGC
jgi:hypothetical protein